MRLQDIRKILDHTGGNKKVNLNFGKGYLVLLDSQELLEIQKRYLKISKQVQVDTVVINK